MLQNLTNYRLILASNSPRRKELLNGLGLSYEVRLIDGIDESYPSTLPIEDIATYIAQKKANNYFHQLADDELLLTADTLVAIEGEVLGKPTDAEDAKSMLRRLSGKTHEVITGVVLTTSTLQRSFSTTSKVTFSVLDDDEIEFYVSNFQPFDKAGSYGIQEWIGYVAVERMEGSYFNIMGLPVQRLYQELKCIEFKK